MSCHNDGSPVILERSTNMHYRITGDPSLSVLMSLRSTRTLIDKLAFVNIFLPMSCKDMSCHNDGSPAILERSTKIHYRITGDPSLSVLMSLRSTPTLIDKLVFVNIFLPMSCKDMSCHNDGSPVILERSTKMH